MDIDDVDRVRRQIELHMDRLTRLLRSVKRRLRIVVGTENLPHRAGPCGLRHPQHAAAVRRPQMRVHTFEDSAMIT